MRAWAGRHSTALIVCGAILLTLVLLYSLFVGFGAGAGEGGVSTVTTGTAP